MTQRDEDTTAVSFTGAVRAFGSVRAVDGVDLRIGRGETVALLGRNGAGKSTTIGMLLGLYPPDAGRVELFGSEPERAVRAGRVGAMLQDARPVPRVTVGELVGFVASRYPAPMPVSRALELAGISALAGRRVDRLSGGRYRECGSRWRWRAIPRCWSSTSRRRRWTWRRGMCSGSRCAGTPGAGTPCSSPPTIWRRRTPSPTGSWSWTGGGSSRTARARSCGGPRAAAWSAWTSPAAPRTASPCCPVCAPWRWPATGSGCARTTPTRR